MDKNKTDNEVVLRTGKAHEFDMAKSMLSEHKIPFTTMQESVSGLKVSAPVTSAPGPGQWWAVLVPSQVVDEARAALSELPFEIETNPDIWHLGTPEKARIGWRVYAWIVLGLSVLFLICYVLSLLD